MGMERLLSNSHVREILRDALRPTMQTGRRSNAARMAVNEGFNRLYWGSGEREREEVVPEFGGTRKGFACAGSWDNSGGFIASGFRSA